MSAAHLHAVPDPDPETDQAPGPGEGLALAPTVVAPRPPLDDELPDDDQDDADEDLADEDDADDIEKRPGLLRELQPYYDPRPLAELGPLAVEVGKAAGPPLLRGIARLLRGLVRAAVWYGRGIGVLLAALTGWLGKSGEARARLGGAVAVLYGLVHLSGEYPYVWPLAAAALALAVLLAAAGLIKVPKAKPEKKDAKKTSDAKKGAPESETEAPSEKGSGKPEEEPSEAPRKGLFARLLKEQKETEEAPEEDDEKTPEEAPEGGSENAPEEAPETAGKETPERPVEDPLTALIRKEIGTENGVHLRDLRPAMRRALPGLAEAGDKELRALLVKAGWDPTRTFRARGVAGRAGVHRNQLPPRHSPESGPAPSPRLSPAPGEGPRPVNSPVLSAPLQGGGEWSEEEKARGFRSAPDPENGPSASRIEHYGGDRK
ncbi:hypothetical protein ACPCSP_25665 [Streptomyces cinereoruber]|uniref:hypothetical protein n=1 Tax=Streptomyces cinereoruber TaxID=67260 RepID=UPI003C2D80C8